MVTIFVIFRYFLLLFQAALAQLEVENQSANNDEYKRLIPRRQKQSNNEQISLSNIPSGGNNSPLDRRRPNGDGQRRRPNAQPESSANQQNFQQNAQKFSSRENINVPRRLKTENGRTQQRTDIPPRLNNEERATPSPIRNEFVPSPPPQRIENVPSTLIPQPPSDGIIGHRPANHRLQPISSEQPIPEFRPNPSERRPPQPVFPNAIPVTQVSSTEQPSQRDPARAFLRNNESKRRGGQRQQVASTEDTSAPRSTTSSEEVVPKRNFPSRTRSRGNSRDQLPLVSISKN